MRATGLSLAISLAATLGVSSAAWCAPGNSPLASHAPLNSSDMPSRPGMPLKGANPLVRGYGDEPGGDAAAPSRTLSRHDDSGQTTDGGTFTAPAQVHSRYSAHSAVLDTLGVSQGDSSSDAGDSNNLGITVRPLTLAERQANGVKSGLMVTDVSGGLGLKAGFHPGDVVLSLDGVDLTSTDQFYKLIQKLPHDRPVPVLVRRPNSTLFLPLAAPARR